MEKSIEEYFKLVQDAFGLPDSMYRGRKRFPEILHDYLFKNWRWGSDAGLDTSRYSDYSETKNGVVIGEVSDYIFRINDVYIKCFVEYNSWTDDEYLDYHRSVFCTPRNVMITVYDNLE